MNEDTGHDNGPELGPQQQEEVPTQFGDAGYLPDAYAPDEFAANYPPADEEFGTPEYGALGEELGANGFGAEGGYGDVLGIFPDAGTDGGDQLQQLLAEPSQPAASAELTGSSSAADTDATSSAASSTSADPQATPGDAGATDKAPSSSTIPPPDPDFNEAENDQALNAINDSDVDSTMAILNNLRV